MLSQCISYVSTWHSSGRHITFNLNITFNHLTFALPITMTTIRIVVFFEPGVAAGKAMSMIVGSLTDVFTPEGSKVVVRLSKYQLCELNQRYITAVNASVVVFIVCDNFLESTLKMNLGILKLLESLISNKSSTVLVSDYACWRLLASEVCSALDEHRMFKKKLLTIKNDTFKQVFTEELGQILGMDLCEKPRISIFPHQLTDKMRRFTLMLANPIPDVEKDTIEVYVVADGLLTPTLAVDIKRDNPYNITACIPVDKMVGSLGCRILKVSLFIGSRFYGTTQVKFTHVSEYTLDEMELLKLSHSIPSLDLFSSLDRFFAFRIETNIKKSTNFRLDPQCGLLNDLLERREALFANVLHVAGFFSWKLVATVVIRSKDGISNLNQINKFNQTPIDIAIERGNKLLYDLMIASKKAFRDKERVSALDFNLQKKSISTVPQSKSSPKRVFYKLYPFKKASKKIPEPLPKDY